MAQGPAQGLLFNKIFGQPGGGVEGLLGNPMLQVGMGLLAARHDGRINPFEAAMTGMANASQFRMLEQDRKREQEEQARQDKARQLAQDVIGKMHRETVQMGPPTPDGQYNAEPGPVSPYGQALQAVAMESPYDALSLAINPQGSARPTAAIQNIAERERRVAMYGEGSPEVQAFDSYVMPPQLFNGVPVSRFSGGVVGGPGAVDTAAGIAGTVAGATQQGQNQQDLNYGFVKDAVSGTYAAREGYNLAESMYNTSRQLREQIESGVLDTGPIDSLMYQLFGVGTEELASMNADQVKATLDNLQITNLAPVTVQELRTIAGLWADIAKQEKPNIGVLKRAEQKSLAVMERMIGDAAMQAERVKQYGTPGEYDRLYQTNPFVRMAIEGKAQEGKPDPAQFNTFEEYKAAVQKWQGGQR